MGFGPFIDIDAMSRYHRRDYVVRWHVKQKLKASGKEFIHWDFVDPNLYLREQVMWEKIDDGSIKDEYARIKWLESGKQDSLPLDSTP